MQEDKRLGSQTPTKAVYLPYDHTLSAEVVDLYEKSGRKAQEWQQMLLDQIMGQNADDLWTHTKFGYSLPRRNGKNEILVMRELWGLFHGEQILHTAHRTTASHTAWEKLLRVLDLARIEYKSLRASGREQITLTDTDGRIEFRTRTSNGGLGEGFDLLVIDEAQEYTDDQASTLKYVVTDSKNPQTIMCGTPPTAVSAGTMFPNYRKEMLGGSLPNSGWAEWSVEQESDVHDVDAWYATNPSLGTIFTERSIQDEIGSDTVDFNIQRLGLWITYNQKSVITLDEWNALLVKRLPKLQGPLFVGIRYGNDGANVAMSIAVKTSSGKIFIEAIDCRSVRAGNQWIIEFLKQAEVAQVVIDGASGQGILAKEMKEARLKAPILPTVKEVINANALWEQALYQQTMQHKEQPSLTQVVTNCEKRNIGSSGGFGYRSQFDDMDIALMESAIFAHWACSETKPAKKQKVWY
ncbi:MAG: terminase large subunit [Aerococcus sp.]|nr:terminase large subunit [Aerococcus sp.]